MFGISTVEFVVIAVVALLLFSPKELPAIIRSFTKFWGSLRATADDFRDAIMNEEELDEIKKAIKGGKDELKKAETAARRELMKARMEMQKAQNKLIKTVKASEQAQKDAIAAAPPETPAADAATNGPPPAPAEAAPDAATEPAVAPAPAPEPMGPSGTVPQADGKVDQGAA